MTNFLPGFDTYLNATRVVHKLYIGNTRQEDVT